MRLLAVLFVMVLPVQAAALSCLRPSPERSFSEVQGAVESYLVVHGRLTFETRKSPKVGRKNGPAPKLTRVPARMTGYALSGKGFKTPFDKNLTLEVRCLGPWCGSAQNGEQVLAFIRRDGAQHFLEVLPCGGRVFANPKRAVLKQMQSCMKRGRC